MKILLAYSGSPGSMNLVENTVKRAKALGAEVHVVTSLAGHGELPREATAFFGGETPAPIQDRLVANRYTREIREAEEGLDRVGREFGKAGVPCETHVLIRGRSPARDIVEFAAKGGIDEVVIGVRRRSALGKMIFGSAAREIIAEAPCTVVSVRY